MSGAAYLEFLPSVLIERAIIIQDVDEFQLVSDSNLIIIRVVCWGDFHSSGTKRHIDNDIIRHDRDATVDERMHGELAMKVLDQQKVDV